MTGVSIAIGARRGSVVCSGVGGILVVGAGSGFLAAEARRGGGEFCINSP